MTDAELKVIGMTRAEWDNSLEDELGYIQEWAGSAKSTDL